MKKMLFAAFAAVLVVAAMFLPIARAGPVMDPTDLVFAVPSANFFLAEKVGIVAQLPVAESGLSVYAYKDLEAVRGYQSREWVGNRSCRVRITKWPGVVVASTIMNFNNPARTFSSGAFYVDRV